MNIWTLRFRSRLGVWVRVSHSKSEKSHLKCSFPYFQYSFVPEQKLTNSTYNFVMYVCHRSVIFNGLEGG